MKVLAVAGMALVLLVAALVLGWTVEDSPRESGGSANVVGAHAQPPAFEVERWRELEQRIEALTSDVELLRIEIDRIGSARHVEPLPPSEPVATGQADREPGQPTPLWYLDQYERSFDAGGEGSEYFRLAVDAYSRELLVPIESRVRSHGKPLAFRVQLVAIVGGPRFVHHGRVIALLLWTIANTREKSLIAQALESLETVGDAAAYRALAALVWQMLDHDLQRHAIDLIAARAGPESNALLYQLMLGAPDDAMLAHIVGALSSSQPLTALDAFRFASQASKPVRLVAAHAVGNFRGPEFEAFVEGWAAAETDPEVLAALGRAREKQRSVPQWSAQQALGPPDAGADRDDPRAWATREADMGEQWLELGYSPPLRASGLRIFEVNAPGAITRVIGHDEQGGEHLLWSGTDPTTAPGLFELSFPATSFRVTRIRLILDTSRTSGWNEIDAVELLGPDGRVWASSASASSEYGQ